MDSYQYLVIGGGIAGERAAEGIRKVDTAGTIALVTAESAMPYDHPPLSKGYLIGTEGLEKVYLREEPFYAENRIEVLREAPATELDRAARRVTLADGRVLGYQALLLATGGTALRLPIPGNDLPGVFTLRTIADADAIREAAQPGKRALVVGGSFMGAEGAACLAQRGAQVSMVFPESRLLARVGPDELSSFLQARYEGNGVRLLIGRKPARFEGRGRVERVVLDDGQALEVDLVVLGVGIRLNTELARQAGLALDERGAVLVDQYLRSSDPAVYAAGDIAAWPDPTFGKRLRVEHWDVARQQGIRAGRNMAGEGKPYTAVPYFYSDIFDLALEAWGDLGAWDQTLLRGSYSTGHFYLFYFAQGRMVGVLVGKPSEAERKQMPALVRVRLAYADAAGRLRDEGADLATLIPA